MPEPRGDLLDVRPLSDQQRRTGVAEVMHPERGRDQADFTGSGVEDSLPEVVWPELAPARSREDESP
jgi:hypothetical protein